MERGTMQRVLSERREGLGGGGGVGRDSKRVKRGDREAFPNPDITRRKLGISLQDILPRGWDKFPGGVNAGELGTKLDPWMKGGDAILGFRPEHNSNKTGPDVHADKFKARNKESLSSRPTYLSRMTGTIRTNRSGPPDMQETSSRTQADMQKEPSARPNPTSYWTALEQTEFTALIAHLGKDWEAIALHMGTKTRTMVKNNYLRLVEGGNKDLQRVAEEADKRRSMGKWARVPTPPIRRQEIFNFEDAIDKDFWDIFQKQDYEPNDNFSREFFQDRKREEVGVSSAFRHERFPTADDQRGVATNSESPPSTPSQSNKPRRRGSPEIEFPPVPRELNRNPNLQEMGPSRHGSIRARRSTSQHLPRSGKGRQAKREERVDMDAYRTSARMRQKDRQAALDSTVAAENGVLDLTPSEFDALSPAESALFLEKPIRTSNLDKSSTLSSNFKNSGLYMRYTISQDASMKTASPFQGTLNSVLDRKRKFRQE